MKRIVLSISFLLLLPALSFAQPAIRFDEVSYDFGAVGQEDTVKHVFEFTNTGDQELVIEKASGS
jgi:hypothetical protein